MLKVYGTKICPDCIACEASFKKYGIGYEFVNIFATMPGFKEFLRLRDASPAFAHAKEQGSVGIPACVKEDGEIFTDWEGFLKDQGLEPIWPEAADQAKAEIAAQRDLRQHNC